MHNSLANQSSLRQSLCRKQILGNYKFTKIMRWHRSVKSLANTLAFAMGWYGKKLRKSRAFDFLPSSQRLVLYLTDISMHTEL